VSERPAAVRLDDLAEPQFSPMAREILDGMAGMAAGLELAPEPLLAQARATTGLDDFGAEPAWSERLEVLLGALDSEAPLSDAGG
jgi:hypothetical protein